MFACILKISKKINRPLLYIALPEKNNTYNQNISHDTRLIANRRDCLAENCNGLLYLRIADRKYKKHNNARDKIDSLTALKNN